MYVSTKRRSHLSFSSPQIFSTCSSSSIVIRSRCKKQMRYKNKNTMIKKKDIYKTKKKHLVHLQALPQPLLHANMPQRKPFHNPSSMQVCPSASPLTTPPCCKHDPTHALPQWFFAFLSEKIRKNRYYLDFQFKYVYFRFFHNFVDVL